MRERENDFLHELVQSLEDHELRFCIDFAESTRKRPEKMLELLQDLRKAKTYNPQRLRTKYRSLEVIKFKLKQHILRSLRMLESQLTADQEISNHIANEGILYRKGIYDQARRELDQARKLAEEHQSMGRLLEVLQLEQLRCLETKTRDLESAIERNRHYIMEVMSRYNEEVAAITQYQQRFSSYRTQDRPLEDKVSQPEPPGEFPPTFNTRLYNAMTASLLARTSGDFYTASREIKKAIDLFDAHGSIKAGKIPKYKILLANYAVSLIPQRAFDEIKELLLELDRIEDLTYNEKAESFQNTVHIRLLLMLNTLDFEGLEDVAKRVEEGMVQHGDKINAARKLAIWHNLFTMHFIREDYKSAIACSGRIIEIKKDQVRKEIQYTTRLMELIAYQELDIWDEARNTALERYLSRKDEMTPFKMSMVRSIAQLERTPLFERKEVYRSLAQTLQSIAESPSNTDTLELKVLAAWTHAKLEEKPLKDCLAPLLA
jgi:tetratricopeptide (TPR) repeat protein